MNNKDLGRSGADAPSGSRPTDGAGQAVSTADAASIPNAGDYVVFCEYGDTFTVKQVAKVTPTLIKFEGRQWPRQVDRRKVLAWSSDREVAEHFKQGAAGIMGEFNRRRRLADEDHRQRIADARHAADKAIARLLASGIEAPSGGETHSGSTVGESPAPEGGDAP